MNHRPKTGPLRGMVQDMKTDQAAVEILIASMSGSRFLLAFCISLSKSDIKLSRFYVKAVKSARIGNR